MGDMNPFSKAKQLVDEHAKANIVIRFAGEGLIELFGDGIHFTSLTNRLGKGEWFSISTRFQPLALDERRLQLIHLIVQALNKVY